MTQRLDTVKNGYCSFRAGLQHVNFDVIGRNYVRSNIGSRRNLMKRIHFIRDWLFKYSGELLGGRPSGHELRC